MKPIIKWPGGKSSEIDQIKDLIPDFDRYIELFFGGGALFFELEPNSAVINDISKELIQFYKLLKDDDAGVFKKELMKYVEAWERIDKYLEFFGNDFLDLYEDYRHNKLIESELVPRIDKLFMEKIIPFNGLFETSFCVDREALLHEIKKNLISKLMRTKTKVDTENNFSKKDISDNIESAFRSGLYLHFRSILNLEKRGKISLKVEKKIANYYFIREFCYGGMFRFNSKGDFNVPYGGIAYNKKDFRSKVDYATSEKIRKLLKNSRIDNLDFETLLKSIKLTDRDFIFLDPPYDTEFSEYDDNPFTKDDQVRLANILYALKAKWILVIKETPFILDLYSNRAGINITTFDKGYLFNIKERNEREVKHLIIHNIGKPLQQKLLIADTLSL